MGWEKKRIGTFGERVALEFLKRNGYKILETNWRTPFGEIDIVARQEDFIVFAEVKTRATFSLGPPYLAITSAKKRHIARNALSYLKMRGLADSNWRIDIISVELTHDYEVEKIELFENAIEDFI